VSWLAQSALSVRASAGRAGSGTRPHYNRPSRSRETRGLNTSRAGCRLRRPGTGCSDATSETPPIGEASTSTPAPHSADGRGGHYVNDLLRPPSVRVPVHLAAVVGGIGNVPGVLTSVGNMYADPFTDKWPGFDPAHIGYVFTLRLRPGQTSALVTFVVKGDDAWSRLKHEAGPHRVQRVPATESQGRIHTSAATVASDVRRLVAPCAASGSGRSTSRDRRCAGR